MAYITSSTKLPAQPRYVVSYANKAGRYTVLHDTEKNLVHRIVLEKEDDYEEFLAKTSEQWAEWLVERV